MNQSLTLSRLFKLLVGSILMSLIASLTITSQLRPAGYSKISSALTNFLSFNLTSFSLIVSPGALLYMIFPGPSMCSNCCSRAAIPLQHWPICLLRRELHFTLCSPYVMSIQGLLTIVPIQLSDYIFKSSNYDVYVHHCAMILLSPRGCAALLQGGIVGHLARKHLAIESACLGPSSTVTVHRISFNIIDGIGKKYWDDELTNDEIDVI